MTVYYIVIGLANVILKIMKQESYTKNDVEVAELAGDAALHLISHVHSKLMHGYMFRVAKTIPALLRHRYNVREKINGKCVGMIHSSNTKIESDLKSIKKEKKNNTNRITQDRIKLKIEQSNGDTTTVNPQFFFGRRHDTKRKGSWLIPNLLNKNNMEFKNKRKNKPWFQQKLFQNNTLACTIENFVKSDRKTKMQIKNDILTNNKQYKIQNMKYIIDLLQFAINFETKLPDNINKIVNDNAASSAILSDKQILQLLKDYQKDKDNNEEENQELDDDIELVQQVYGLNKKPNKIKANTKITMEDL